MARRAAEKPLEIRLLGELAVLRNGSPAPLPQSKKTRALLAYLVLTNRPLRRERLCSLFWDVTDDPRGALRWSLSKLRPLLDDRGTQLLNATRDAVEFAGHPACVDLLRLRSDLNAGVESQDTERLVALEKEFRGEFLEGLELPDFFEFQAWCVGQRETARLLHLEVLEALAARFEDDAEQALFYARRLLDVDPLSEDARVRLLRLLARLGRWGEAKQHYEASLRLARELGSGGSGEVGRVWEEIAGRRRESAAPAPEASARESAVSSAPPDAPIDREPRPSELVGRSGEWAKLTASLRHVREARAARVVLLLGEPGVGKTRLLLELAEEARSAQATLLEGQAYEVERNRPYGPWVDALRCLPRITLGDTIGKELAPLLPELGRSDTTADSRERLFGAVVELVAARAHSAPPVLVSLDDVQWLDNASVELLHYVARMNRHRPLLVLLAARTGELSDNAALDRLLRNLRRAEMLEEIEVGPLSREETAALVRRVARQADAESIFAECGGNPLFAMELARSRPRQRAGVSATMTDLVRDRVARLPAETGDVLRWAAVLGRTFSFDTLDSLTVLDEERLIDALETLVRHGLLCPLSPQGLHYRFSHDVVQQIVYAEVSAPRRRLMHQRIASRLAERGETDDDRAGEIAHHAAQAGEAPMAVRACLAAGRRCLALFAPTEAEALARRGLHFAEELSGPERITLTLELLEISTAARRPADIAATAARVEELSERALDLGCVEHARLGFHILSYLRWEGGDFREAQRQTMRAELVSRAGQDPERVVAMGEAARCLAMLERDLGHAEALALEARALGERTGSNTVAVPAALAMLRMHQGRLDEAAQLFGEARAIAERAQDHVSEFQALEHLIMIALQSGNLARAVALSAALVPLGEKVREGSEGPFGHALAALCGYASRERGAREQLDAALDELRSVDAKHRLAYVLTRAALIDLEQGFPEIGRARATEALRMAEALERPSETALARVALARAAEALGEPVQSHRELLRRQAPPFLSAEARAAIDALLGSVAPAHRKRAPIKGRKRDGPRDGGTKLQ